MKRLHPNALLFGLMLFLIQLALIFIPGKDLADGYLPLLGYVVTGNGSESGVAIEHLVAGTGLMSPSAALIWVCKHFAGKDSPDE